MDGGDPVIGYRGTPYPHWKKKGSDTAWMRCGEVFVLI